MPTDPLPPLKNLFKLKIVLDKTYTLCYTISRMNKKLIDNPERITAYLDRDLHVSAKKYCKENYISFSSLVNQLLKKFLAGKNK